MVQFTAKNLSPDEGEWYRTLLKSQASLLRPEDLRIPAKLLCVVHLMDLPHLSAGLCF